MLNGRTDGLATDAWTSRQVEARKGRSGPALLAEWNEAARGFEALALPTQALADVE